MKQLEHFNDLKNNLIYPIYLDQAINLDICTALAYDLNLVVDKNYQQLTTIHTLGKCDFQKITFIGLGKKDEITTKKIRNITNVIVSDKPSILYLNDIDVNHLDIHHITRALIESYLIASYQETKIGHDVNEIVAPDVFYDKENLRDDIEMAEKFAEGINYGRYLSDLPANLLTPNHLVTEAMKLSKAYHLECTILNKKDLETMHAGGILAVNQGSHIPAYMICLKYTNSSTPFTALVGKGITFDSGGYNIKNNSYGMKYDMCGAGDVLAIMKILAATKAKANVYGIIPTTENLVNEHAYKPQDVITTLSKQTVEIVSTDAEGRLILCDAITYAQQLGIKQIIDIATLTGACVAALGDVYTGVFSNDDEYYQAFEQAMKQSDEKGWRLPIDDEYFAKLKSKSADFKNSAGKPGAGASIAANFLAAFIEPKTKWIHLDVAGTADNDGTKATGAMIKSIVNFVSE